MTDLLRKALEEPEPGALSESENEPGALDAVIAARAEAGRLGAFLEFLHERGLRLCREYEFGYSPDPNAEAEVLIAAFLGLNLTAAYSEFHAQTQESES